MIKEFKRSIINYQFLIVCIISIILFSISSYSAVWRSALNASSATDLTSEGVKWILQSSGNKYNIWNQSFKIMGIIYPILLSSVYVYSYVEEYKNGFRLLMISRFILRIIIRLFMIIHHQETRLEESLLLRISH